MVGGNARARTRRRTRRKSGPATPLGHEVVSAAGRAGTLIVWLRESGEAARPRRDREVRGAPVAREADLGCWVLGKARSPIPGEARQPASVQSCTTPRKGGPQDTRSIDGWLRRARGPPCRHHQPPSDGLRQEGRGRPPASRRAEGCWKTGTLRTGGEATSDRVSLARRTRECSSMCPAPTVLGLLAQAASRTRPCAAADTPTPSAVRPRVTRDRRLHATKKALLVPEGEPKTELGGGREAEARRRSALGAGRLPASRRTGLELRASGGGGSFAGARAPCLRRQGKRGPVEARG